jgi:hypothetical protein
MAPLALNDFLSVQIRAPEVRVIRVPSFDIALAVAFTLTEQLRQYRFPLG